MKSQRVELLKIEKRELEDFLCEKLNGDFLELDFSDDVFTVVVAYENINELKKELLETLKYKEENLEYHIDEVISDYDEESPKSNLYAEFKLEHVKKLIEEDFNCKLSSSNEFYVDLNCEYILFYLN